MAVEVEKGRFLNFSKLKNISKSKIWQITNLFNILYVISLKGWTSIQCSKMYDTVCIFWLVKIKRSLPIMQEVFKRNVNRN